MSQKINNWHGIDLEKSLGQRSHFDSDGRKFPDTEAKRRFEKDGTLVFRAIGVAGKALKDELHVLHLIDDLYFLKWATSGVSQLTDNPENDIRKGMNEASGEWDVTRIQFPNLTKPYAFQSKNSVPPVPNL